MKNIVNNYDKMVAEGTVDEEVNKLINSSTSFFKNYNKEVDKAKDAIVVHRYQFSWRLYGCTDCTERDE